MDFVNKQYFEEELKEFVKQNLSENDWINISRYQTLSENFIQEFQDKVNWQYLRFNKKIQVSDEFTIEFDKKLNYYNCWRINNQLHRILGPAKIFYNGKKKYWYRGKQVLVDSDKEYFEWLKYKDF